MGSVYFLTIDDYPIWESKAPPPESLTSLFTSKEFIRKRRRVSDRNPLVWGEFAEEDHQTREMTYQFQAPAWVIRDRLELLGFTVPEFSTSLKQWKREQENVYRSIGMSSPLRGLNHAKARRVFHSLLQRKERGQPYDPAGLSELETALFKLINSGDIDELLLLRELVECVEPVASIVLDLTDQVNAKYSAREASKFAVSGAPSGARIVVITEGVTDTEVLQESLRLLYPHLAEFFIWPDLQNRAGGGANGIANTLKSILPFGITAPVVALFDNDAEGNRVARQLEKELGDVLNLRVLTLPSLESVRSWPSEGPDGLVKSDLNGKAASIECFFGSDVLGIDDARPLVRWSKSGKEWQGSFDNKSELKERFLRKARMSTPANLQGDWSDMQRLVDLLIRPDNL